MEDVHFQVKSCHIGEDKSSRWRLFTPLNLIFIGYLIVIVIGTLLLLLPWSTPAGHIGFTDALFTATSATTVTGLVVKDTGTGFTAFGQAVLLVLIHIGGTGYMSLFGFFLLSGHRDVSLHNRMLLKETLNSPTVKGIGKMARRIFSMIVFIEIIGALALFIRWLPEYGKKALWLGIFHSVSAFNNAGFDIVGGFRSFTEYKGDVWINITITTLVIVGGLGFYVLSDVYRILTKRKRAASYQTQVVLAVTLFLIVAGTLGILASEYSNPATLGDMTLGEKVMASYFHSVSARTAGFSTLNMRDFVPATLLLMIALMFIGASPGGAGGGVKTTTFAILAAYMKSSVENRETIHLGRRRITYQCASRASAIVILSIAVIFLVTFLIGEIERAAFMDVIFETFSAYGTVGLSVGLTSVAHAASKYLLMLTMLCGKVGVLTMILFFSREKKKINITLPTGDLTV